MKTIASMRLGYNGGYEIQVFSKGRIWLRLTRDPQRNNLAFWSGRESALAEWTAIAAELDRRLRDVAVDDRPAIDRACEYWPEGWDFWGPEVPAPIRDVVWDP